MSTSDDRSAGLPETTPYRPTGESFSGETSSPAPSGGAAAGPRAGPFLLLDELSPTAQDTVVRARDERLGRVLRVRMLRLPAASDPASRAAFAREVQSLSGVSHPHLAAGVLEADLDAVEPYVALAQPRGTPLTGFGPRSRSEAGSEGLYPNRRLAEAMLNSAWALGALHAAGLVHGNLRPDCLRALASGTDLLVGPGGPPEVLSMASPLRHRRTGTVARASAISTRWPPATSPWLPGMRRTPTAGPARPRPSIPAWPTLSRMPSTVAWLVTR